MVAAGGLMGIRTGMLLLIGAVINYCILAPWAMEQGLIEGTGFRNILKWGMWGGVSMMTTAAALARFYEMILAGGTTADGARLIRSETLERYLGRSVAGFDRALRSYMVLGRGFLLGWLGPHPYGWWNTRSCFGHPGGLSTLAFGDHDTGLATAIVTNGNRGFADLARRFMPLARGLVAACQ